jgi:hypothetical protein
MAPRFLPKPPRETEISIREISNARDMRPTTGGRMQRQDRLGTKHAITFDIPVLRYAWCGAGLAADLARGRTGDGCAILIPEPGIPNINYGLAPKVDGAGQLGSSIAVKDLTPGVTIPKGKWFNLVADGRYYAYFADAQVTADGNGKAVLPIYPMIRRSVVDGDPFILKEPYIQGLITEPLQRKILRRIGIGLTFEIEEIE